MDLRFGMVDRDFEDFSSGLKWLVMGVGGNGSFVDELREDRGKRGSLYRELRQKLWLNDGKKFEKSL